MILLLDEIEAIMNCSRENTRAIRVKETSISILALGFRETDIELASMS
jgi:hypothetical protein